MRNRGGSSRERHPAAPALYLHRKISRQEPGEGKTEKMRTTILAAAFLLSRFIPLPAAPPPVNLPPLPVNSAECSDIQVYATNPATGECSAMRACDVPAGWTVAYDGCAS
jgi:hypothetical protein